MERNVTRTVKGILKRKNKVEDQSIQSQDFLYSYSNQVCVVLEEEKHLDQWDWAKNWETDKHKSLIFNRDTKAIPGRTTSLFNEL